MKRIVKNILAKFNLSQYDLALILDVSPTTVYRWVTDNLPKIPDRSHRAVLHFLDEKSPEQFHELQQEFFDIQLKVHKKANEGNQIAKCLMGNCGMTQYYFYLYKILKEMEEE